MAMTGLTLFGLFACAAPPPPARTVAVTPPPIPASTPALPLVDETERACLAEAIYFEARSEPRDAQAAIAQVVVNRAADAGYPGKICEVIRQGENRGRGKCQFSWRCDGLADKPREMEAWAAALHLAQDVLVGALPDRTGGALWFHNTEGEAPSWAAKLTRTAELGSHAFYTR